ncbi:MAG: arsenosugar biosynthesis radical SAM protein ArsS [Candidatus Sumerlaeia bacterium]|nr:arsenosugar biosynthesis radical SAM protein ArsS [Candidatus Sumerlaeia bacterium]
MTKAVHRDRFQECLGTDKLHRTPLEILQVNVGRLCNQTCRHCHVNAGPTRTELMSQSVAEMCVATLDRFPGIHTLDITGGAPEMAPPFRYLVQEARNRGLRVIDRCNLTILSEPGYEDLAEFLSQQQVDVVASLPCYTADNVDKQRGDGVFAASINGLRLLNEKGFGLTEGNKQTPGHRLDLVYNPGGPSLPPPQKALEQDYRKRLWEDFGVRFDSLICITNMAIGRFRSDLLRAGKLELYEQKLVDAFNPATVPSLMCRNTVSVDYEGWLYDCDFNQMLNLPLGAERLHLRDLTSAVLEERAIATAVHCLGCTAGSGSSCGGSLVGK